MEPIILYKNLESLLLCIQQQPVLELILAFSELAAAI
jgi:hypothetical protein